MKRILILILILALALPFCSCAKDENTRTYCFYNEMDKKSFWFACTITENGETYRYAQAVDSDSVTIIEDHDDDLNDGYGIYDIDTQLLHSLNFSTKKYDTRKTDKGLNFLFGNNEAVQFRAPDDSEDEVEFEGNTYYCEIFETVNEEGDEVGLNKYYFDGMTLKAIEWIENDVVVKTMRLTEYSNEIPSSVYTSIPAGFKAGNFIEEDIIMPR